MNTGTRNTDVIELLPGSMVSADMLADNPGSWMLHCHVGDHMESGMMAIYTIYPPPNPHCPVKFTAGNFWGTSGKFTVTVKNSSGKPIRNLTVTAEDFLAPQDLRRPFDFTWTSTSTIPPNQEQTIEKPAYPEASAQAVRGWAFLPTAITYTDGTSWHPKNDGECFKVFWQDKDHPEIPALPPRQDELNPD